MELHTCARRAKKDKSAQEAINQITPNGAQSEQKNYVDRVRDCKEILLVGISYSDTDNKKHTCIIEEYK